jgi:hypothetical protein
LESAPAEKVEAYTLTLSNTMPTAAEIPAEVVTMLTAVFTDKKMTSYKILGEMDTTVVILRLANTPSSQQKSVANARPSISCYKRKSPSQLRRDRKRAEQRRQWKEETKASERQLISSAQTETLVNNLGNEQSENSDIRPTQRVTQFAKSSVVLQPVGELAELFVNRGARAKDKASDVSDSAGVTVSEKCVSVPVTSCTVLTSEASRPETVVAVDQAPAECRPRVAGATVVRDRPTCDAIKPRDSGCRPSSAVVKQFVNGITYPSLLRNLQDRSRNTSFLRLAINVDGDSDRRLFGATDDLMFSFPLTTDDQLDASRCQWFCKHDFGSMTTDETNIIWQSAQLPPLKPDSSYVQQQSCAQAYMIQTMRGIRHYLRLKNQ